MARCLSTFKRKIGILWCTVLYQLELLPIWIISSSVVVFLCDFFFSTRFKNVYRSEKLLVRICGSLRGPDKCEYKALLMRIVLSSIE